MCMRCHLERRSCASNCNKVKHFCQPVYARGCMYVCEREREGEREHVLARGCMLTCRPRDGCMLTCRPRDGCMLTCRPRDGCMLTCRPRDGCMLTIRPRDGCMLTCRPRDGCMLTCRPRDGCSWVGWFSGSFTGPFCCRSPSSPSITSTTPSRLRLARYATSVRPGLVCLHLRMYTSCIQASTQQLHTRIGLRRAHFSF
jgi:hypothetical protein